MTRTTRLPPLPAAPQVVEALQALADGLDGAAGSELVALVLHGGLARGSFRPDPGRLTFPYRPASSTAARARTRAAYSTRRSSRRSW